MKISRRVFSLNHRHWRSLGQSHPSIGCLGEQRLRPTADIRRAELGTFVFCATPRHGQAARLGFLCTQPLSPLIRPPRHQAGALSPAMSCPSANRPCTRQFLRLAPFRFSSFFRFFFVRAKARRPRTENGPSWIAHVALDDVPTRRQSEKGEPMCLAQFVVIKQSEVVRDSY